MTFQNAISLGGHRFRSCWGLRSCFFTASTCYCCHGPHKHFAPKPLAIIKKIMELFRSYNRYGMIKESTLISQPTCTAVQLFYLFHKCVHVPYFTVKLLLQNSSKVQAVAVQHKQSIITTLRTIESLRSK